MKTDVAIVGAGPAGMMAAGQAARAGARVLVLEKNPRPGRKLMITGKGRCNITNNCDTEAFLAAVRSNPRFLFSAASAFPPAAAMRFFEQAGVPLKTERGNRVFPQSDKARDVVDAMADFMRHPNVSVLQKKVKHLLFRDGVLAGVLTEDGGRFEAGAAVVCTGGKSYPLTGSTGDGYRLAQEVGHTVVPPKPSLIPIVTSETWCREVSGLSLRNVVLTLKKGKKTVYSELGEMLFTHFGVSGPLVLSASSHMDGPAGEYRLLIDLNPGLTPEKLDARILRDFEEAKNREFKNALDALLPKSLIPVIVRLSGIPPEIRVNSVTRPMRQKLAGLIKGLPLTPSAFRPIDEAIVTAGGVRTSEIDPKTMQSKLVRGLYFAGEVLDLDAYTGGYNLQIAYCTGFLAGRSAACAAAAEK